MNLKNGRGLAHTYTHTGIHTRSLRHRHREREKNRSRKREIKRARETQIGNKIKRKRVSEKNEPKKERGDGKI